jgi:anti-sigma regulatory factor (Ser/Thr protein kinase)
MARPDVFHAFGRALAARVKANLARDAAGQGAPRAGDRMLPGFSLRIANRLLELDRVADAVEAFGEAHGLSAKLRYQIRLVLDELLTNTISYGYADDGEHGIHVGMAEERGRLRFLLEDDARPFDPLTARVPDVNAPADERPIGGLGIHLVRTIMDRVAYERVGGVNRLVLEKDI